MGLDISVKGLGYDDTYHGGYGRFNQYRKEVASAYKKELGELYEKCLKMQLSILPAEKKDWDNLKKLWNEICNDDLDIFLFHSDCDGKLTPKECKKIYDVIKDLKVGGEQDFNGKYFYDLHEKWKNMLKYCYKRRTNMYFY